MALAPAVFGQGQKTLGLAQEDSVIFARQGPCLFQLLQGTVNFGAACTQNGGEFALGQGQPQPWAGGKIVAVKLAQLLVRLNRELGLSVLLAEQQLSLIRRVADRFCLLYRGRNVAQGRVSELDDPLLAHWMASAR